MIIPLGPPSLAGSSDLPGSVDRTGRPSGRSHALPYLVLLRAGFCLPRLLPDARCALTAPFHHCLLFRASAVCFLCHCPLGRRKHTADARKSKQWSVSCVFSVPLSVGSPHPGVTRRTALWSSDFPPRRALRLRGCP